MRLLSDANEYGLRAMVWLATQPREPHKVRAIAEAIDAAPGYLIKVLQMLARAGIVSAHRGTTGGYSMCVEPESLSVLEVVSAIDPIDRIRSCPLGLDSHARGLCPLHRRIDDSLAMIERDFARTSLAELAFHRPASEGSCSALSASESGGSSCGCGGDCGGDGGA